MPGQDPISLINSTERQYGNPEFMNSNFPGEENIFLRFQSGKMIFFKQPVIVKCTCFGQLCAISSTPAPCQGCVTADVRQIHVNNVLVGKSTRLMEKYHINKVVRLLSRVLPKVINHQVLEQIGYKRSDIEENRLVVG